MSLALLFHYLMLNMFRMLVHPSSGACDLLWIYFMCSIARVLQAEASFSLHKDTTPPQPNHTVTPTHIEPEQYNTWNKSTISSNLLKMDVLTFETCWAVNSEIIKQVTSSWSIFIQRTCEYSDIFLHNIIGLWKHGILNSVHRPCLISQLFFLILNKDWMMPDVTYPTQNDVQV